MTFEKTLASEIEPQNWIDGWYQEPRRTLLQGFYEMLGRYQDRQSHAQISSGHEEQEEEEVEDHDDHHMMSTTISTNPQTITMMIKTTIITKRK